MFLYRSSDLDYLVDHLARVLSAPGLGLLDSEVILIQSAGMERYLIRELAARQGIVANVVFPYPRAFLLEMLDRVLDPCPQARAYEREQLTWHLLDLLCDIPSGDLYEPVRRNLARDTDGTGRLLLAEQLARLFDQYVTYRPGLVLDWQAGRGITDFQADLWHRLVSRLGPHHLAARFAQFLGDVSDENLRAALPRRLSLVGGPGLPPLYLRGLSRMAEAIPVHVLSFSVSGEYFADLHPVDDPLAELGAGAHPLLTTLGKVGADFQHLVEQVVTYQDAASAFVPPAPTTLLSALQGDIIEGNRREPAARLPASFAADGSITLESCHSRLREVEILADRLGRWFAEDPCLRPEEIVVLAPEIEEYSPLISAVFDARSDGRVRIPYRIADRSEGATSGAAKALMLGLRLLGGRLKASAVLDFLQSGPVLSRFGISALDLETIGGWVKESAIRWGADGDHVASYGLGRRSAHTWSWGLERLLLGYACADDGRGTFEGLVPVDDVTAFDAELLGRFADFCTQLLAFRQRVVAGALSPAEWAQFFRDFVDAFLGLSRDGAWDLAPVQSSIAELWARAEVCEVEHGLALSAAVHLVERALEQTRYTNNFLSGGITFCSLLPLRTIPFRRVCVLGLDQAGFPRAEIPSAQDKIALEPRRGDRTLRADDRFLFLELILSAKERLALSYVGRSVQDNSSCPPSVVVTELRETLADMLEPDPETGRAPEVLEPLIHPLQPFSPRYFQATTPFSSYDPVFFRGAQALAVPRPEDAPACQPFIVPRSSDECALDERGSVELRVPLEPDRPEAPRPHEVALSDLITFLKNPARAFLSGLDVRLDDEIEQFEDRESVAIDALSRWTLGDALLRAQLEGRPSFLAVELGRGKMPVAAAGEIQVLEAERIARILSAQARSLGKQLSPEARDIAVDLGPDRLSGPETTTRGSSLGSVRLSGRVLLSGDRLIEPAFGAADAKRQLALWVEHLAVCAAGTPCESFLVARPQAERRRTNNRADVETIRYFPVSAETAKLHLLALCCIYLRGQEEPVCFFPRAALRFVEVELSETERGRLSAEEVTATALRRAHQDLTGFGAGEALAPEISQVFRDELPLLGFREDKRQRFMALARDIFQPLLRHRELMENDP